MTVSEGHGFRLTVFFHGLSRQDIIFLDAFTTGTCLGDSLSSNLYREGLGGSKGVKSMYLFWCGECRDGCPSNVP